MTLANSYRFLISYPKAKITEKECQRIEEVITHKSKTDDYELDFVIVLTAVRKVCPKKVHAFFDAVVAEYPYLNTLACRSARDSS